MHGFFCVFRLIFLMIFRLYPLWVSLVANILDPGMASGSSEKQVRVRTGVAQLLKLQSGHIWFGLVSLASFGQAWFAFGELI